MFTGSAGCVAPDRQDVRVGDELLWYNASCANSGSDAAAAACSSWRRVVAVEPALRRQKRAFFVASPFALVNRWREVLSSKVCVWW